MALLTNCWGCWVAIFVAIFAIVGAYLYMTRKFLYWKKLGVFEVAPTPFTGNFTDVVLMKKSPGELFRNLHDRSSNLPYMGFYVLDKPFFLVRDPELIKHIFLRDINYFMDRYEAASPDDGLGNANLFMVKHPAWKLVRTKLTPIFTSGKIKKMFEMILEVGEDFDTHLESLDLKGQGKSLDMKELYAQYATDVIGTTAYGLKVNSLNNPDAEFRKSGREIFTFNTWRTYETASIFFTPHLAKLMSFKFFTANNSKFLRQVFWDTINERERTGIKRNDFIDLLIGLKNNQSEEDKQIFEFNGDNLVAQAAIFFLGGFETTSTTISFALYEIALVPEIQNKVRAEIQEGLEQTGGKLTYDMVMTSMPYLDMVVAETLRKYPSLPFLDRITLVDYKVPNSDLVLKKGTPVYVSLTGLHYDPEYFPNPEVFDPERFSEKNKRNRKPFTYMPFGVGPHTCIGMRLGLLESKVGIIHILSKYELSTCKETLIPMRLNPKSFLTAADGGIFLNVRKM